MLWLGVQPHPAVVAGTSAQVTGESVVNSALYRPTRLSSVTCILLVHCDSEFSFSLSPSLFSHAHLCVQQSKSWRHCVGRTVELLQVQRQADQQFIALLQSIRVGR